MHDSTMLTITAAIKDPLEDKSNSFTVYSFMMLFTTENHDSSYWLFVLIARNPLRFMEEVNFSGGKGISPCQVVDTIPTEDAD